MPIREWAKLRRKKVLLREMGHSCSNYAGVVFTNNRELPTEKVGIDAYAKVLRWAILRLIFMFFIVLYSIRSDRKTP
jgi:hypothetical protein